MIETTADRKEYDFHRVLEYYPECSFDSFTIKEYSIIFEHGPEISYLDFHKYIQYKFIQLMGWLNILEGVEKKYKAKNRGTRFL